MWRERPIRVEEFTFMKSFPSFSGSLLVMSWVLKVHRQLEKICLSWEKQQLPRLTYLSSIEVLKCLSTRNMNDFLQIHHWARVTDEVSWRLLLVQFYQSYPSTFGVRSDHRTVVTIVSYKSIFAPSRSNLSSSFSLPRKTILCLCLTTLIVVS